MSTTGSVTQNGSSVSAAVVAVPIVLILVAAIVIGILIILGYMYYRSKYQLIWCCLQQMYMYVIIILTKK